MFDVLYPGRTLIFDSPLSVEEVTRRLERKVTAPSMKSRDTEQLFEGTFGDGQFSFVRLVHGRNSFRPWMKGRVLSGSNGARVELRMQLHPAVLVFGLMFALVGGTIAALAAPEIPVVGRSPLLVRILAMAAVAFIFAALGSFEARLATRLLETVVGANPTSHQTSERTVAQQR